MKARREGVYIMECLSLQEMALRAARERIYTVRIAREGGFDYKSVTFDEELSALEKNIEDALSCNDLIGLDVAYKYKKDFLLTVERGVFELLDAGCFIGFGYSGDADFRIVIPKHEWSFLTVNHERECATYNGLNYAGLRFVDRKRLTQEELEKIECQLNNINGIKKQIECASPNLIDPYIKASQSAKQSHPTLAPATEPAHQKRGRPMGKVSPLTILIKTTYRALLMEHPDRKPTPREVLLEIQDHDDEQIIQEITKDQDILWRDPVTRQDRDPLTFKTLRNRIAKLPFPINPADPD